MFYFTCDRSLIHAVLLFMAARPASVLTDGHSVLLLGLRSFFFLLSTLNLRGRSVDRHQTLPHVRWIPRFIKFGQKFEATPPPPPSRKKWRPTSKFRRVTSQPNSECLRNATITKFIVICIGLGAQSTLGGHKIFARKISIKNQQYARILHDSFPKNYQNARIFMILARKNLQNSRILQDFCPKNARILHNNCPKNIFARILGGHPPPVSYAYGQTENGLANSCELSTHA